MKKKKAPRRKCNKCEKKFVPTATLKITCLNCYRTNGNVSPLAEEPENHSANTFDYKYDFINDLKV